MGDGAHAMEQHGDKLDEDDGEEEEHEHDTNGFQVKVLFCDQDLGRKNVIVLSAFDYDGLWW